MPTIETRLTALELLSDTAQTGLLPTVVPDHTTDAELANLRLTGRKVYRETDPALLDEFIY